jgi:DNA replicative helicase MCM subunit Mcm2 (Cdc46/Mcm family)
MYHYTAIEHSIRGSARKKEAVLRVAYAIAKLNGRSLLIDDALKAIKILNETITESQLEYLRVKALSSGSIV